MDEHAPLKSLAPSARACFRLALSMFAASIHLFASSEDRRDPTHEAFFESRVRPLLVERCYECHGEEKQKGGLRLDSREGWQIGGDSGPAIVPGKPEESLLIKAISHTDLELQMPPKNKLSEREIDSLIQWVRLGAPDPRVAKTAVTNPSAGISIEEGKQFWAYQPPKEVTPPPTASDWPRNDVDRFILSKLNRAGIRPVPDAERTVLIRRAYFDLIGLPPAPEEIDAFLNDPSEDAFAKVVDRLLATPQFGERWARHWLDVARYGESVTLRGLIFQEAWRYRDYVINAFNSGMPFTQFIREQLAGDLLAHKHLTDQQRSLIATTFLTLGNTNLEEQDKQQLDMDVVDEQLDTIGKAFLAQTIGCARCHDHKFDPIPTRDYYALAGILRNTVSMEHANVSDWVEIPLPLPPEEQARFDAHEKAVAALTAQLKSIKERASRLASSEGATSQAIVPVKDLPGIVIDDADAKKVGSWEHSQYSKAYVGDGYLHDQNAGKGEKTLTFQPAIPEAGRYEVRFAYTTGGNRAARVPVTVLSADGEQTIHINQQKTPPIDNRFVSLGIFHFEQNNQGFVLLSTEGTDGFVIADAVQFLPVRPAQPVVANASAPEQKEEDHSEELKIATAQIQELEKQLKHLTANGPKRPMVMTVKEKPVIEDSPIHIRGSVHRLGEIAPRGFLQVATYGEPAPPPKDQSGRVELANWIASSDNPLTARVYVNRVWHWLMGDGLVRTVDNFGQTGDRPSHPELLDYLAIKFMRDGWSTKALIREIMLSRTYQLSTMTDPECEKADPENRLRWRMNQRRLEAECIRDSILTASGQLKLEMGGPTIRPGTSVDYGYQHTNTWRSIYLPVFRNSLPELFRAFDFADPSIVTGARNQSTVPTQALLLMNDDFVIKQARAAAQRLLSDADQTIASRINRAYRMTLGRFPSTEEMKLAMHFLSGPDHNSVDSWTQFCQVLFASIDFRYLN